jgi:tetratricopeptide (TPR) repeat protein
MKSKSTIVVLLVATLFFGCSKSVEYSEDFKKATSGKYNYNVNEIIEVYYEGNDIFIKWRGGNIETISLGENEFFVTDMNKKMQFVKHPETNDQYLSIISEDNTKTTYDYRKMQDNFLTPSMHLEAGNYEEALKGFLEIKKKDSLSPFINERDINRLGYKYFGEQKLEDAIAIFTLNTKLHPTSSNVWDSLGQAYLVSGDSLQAYNNYKKAYGFNTGNRRAKRYVQAYEEKVKSE